CRGDPPTARAGEQPCVRITIDGRDALLHHLVNLRDQRHGSRPLALGAFVDQSAGGSRGLAPDVPRPVRGVDIADPAAGYLTDSRGRARREDHDLTPALILVR